MLDVKRLGVLREVVARGSFSAAAESLHLSQSAVSQQVAALEREVGMQLLERTSDGPKLTLAGETLAGHADAVIARLDEAERELAEIAGLESGRMRLVSFPSASATLVTRAMSEFRRALPGDRTSVRRGGARGVDPGAEARRLRRRGRLRLSDRARGFRARHRGGADLRGADADRAGAGPPAGRVRDRRAQGSRRGGLALWPLPSSCREHVLGLGREAGFEPRISFESDDYEVLKGLVAAGLGVTILPRARRAAPGG